MRSFPPTPLAALLATTSLFAATWHIGPSRTYTTPKSVANLVSDGDSILIDAGTYADEVATWSRNRLFLRGVGGFAHLTAPVSISNGKAIWVIAGNDASVDSIEFSGASVPDRNGAGIRTEGTNLTVRRSYFHDNENGILGGKGTVRVEESEFVRNGFGDGYSHNLYIANCDTFLLLRSRSHQAKIGHEVKSRAKVNILVGNWIGNESSGTASYEIDLPNGGTSVIAGNMIQQGLHSDNPTLVSYGEEGMTNPGKDLHFAHNTLVNDLASGTFLRLAAGTTGSVSNNLYVGAGLFVSGNIDTSRNLAGSSTDLVDRAGYDFRPAAGSKAVDAAVALGSAAGWALLPAYESTRNASFPRPIDGKPDIGAWESQTGIGIFQRGHRASPAKQTPRFAPREGILLDAHRLDGTIRASPSAPTPRDSR
jgi:hypothetical protein